MNLIQLGEEYYITPIGTYEFREASSKEILQLVEGKATRISFEEHIAPWFQGQSIIKYTKSNGYLTMDGVIHPVTVEGKKGVAIRSLMHNPITQAVEAHNNRIRGILEEEGQLEEEAVADYNSKRNTCLDVLFKSFKDRITGRMTSDGLRKEVGEWQRGIPSVNKYKYIVNVGEKQMSICWEMPIESENKSNIVFKACPNIVVEIDKDKVGKGGLSDLIYRGIGEEHKAHQIFYPNWFVELKEVCGKCCPEDPALFQKMKMDPTLEDLIENRLNSLFVHLKNSHLHNEFKLGSGIQHYNSQTPSELQVYPGFYTLFDTHPWETKTITELLARIIGIEMYGAKLYSGLIPHTGGQYKSSIFIQGPGNSFKTYLLERLADALALTWYADGTFSMNPSIDPMTSAFLRTDRAKTGGDMWDDPEGLRRAAFVYWTEEGDKWAPDLPFLKKRTGNDNTTVVAKRKDAKNIPISAVNVFDSNYTISRQWFSEEAYSRCIPIAVFNPSLKTKLPYESYFAIKASGVNDEAFKPYLNVLKKRMRNYQEGMSYSKLSNIYVGCCVLSWVMTYGRDQWELLKSDNGPEISLTAPRNVLQFYRSNVMLGNGMSTLTPISERGTYNLVPLSLTLLASLCEPSEGGRVALSSIDFILKGLVEPRLTNGTSKKDEEIVKAIKRAGLILDGVIRTDSLRFFGVPTTISKGVATGIRIRPQYAHWFSEDSIRSVVKITEKSKWLDVLFDTLRTDTIDFFYEKYVSSLKMGGVSEVPWDPTTTEYMGTLEEEDDFDELP